MKSRDTFSNDVTAPAIGEDAARVAAERKAFAANALPALIGYLDTNVRYVWVNDGYCRWFDCTREQIIGRGPAQLLGAAGWEGIRPYVERALAGEEVTYEHTPVFKGVSRRDARVSYVPDHDENGRVCGFVAMITDITETKAVETALRENQQMLDRSQATAQVGSWTVTLDEEMAEVPGRSLWSKETYRIFGYDPGTQVSRTLFFQRVHPDDLAVLQAQSVLAFARAESFELEYRIVRPDRAVRLIHGWVHFDRGADGKTTRVSGTCQDVTERKLRDAEIDRAREQLQLVVDSTPAFIARYDRNQRLVWSNKSFAARYGKKPDEIVGSRLVDLVGELAFRTIDPFCVRVLAGESIQTELEIPYVSGPRFVHMIATPTLDAAGVPDGCVAVLTDVTHWRRLELERERALNELREADRRKDEFLAMLSHELRNPLAPIMNSVEALERLGPGHEDLASTFSAIIARQARHMKRLLDDLLDVSRVSQGKIELQRERVELSALLREAVEVSRPLLTEKRHELSLSLSLAPLSLALRPLVLEADPTRLVQVFANLINNAAKYTHAGGHIAIISRVDNGEAVVTVRDDGVGMSPDLLARAFDLFVQGTRALDRAQGGLGIGLTLVRTLVKMHGGSVRAFSEGPGRGSELVVRLPLAPAVDSDRADPPPAARGGSSALLRVLVVDDNVDTAAVLGHLLRLLGHQVALAHDGPAALAAAAATPPDLVLLDLGLPGMDGYAIAAQLRAAGHTRAALVALTGYGQEDDMRRSREAGFDHHLIKPVDFTKLQRICALVRGR